MHPFRTRFAKQIVAEFFPPRRPSDKVIIFCPGMPSSPSSSSQLDFYSRKGFWVFSIRYRGSWESAGTFLVKSPEQDVLDVIDQLPKGFKDAMTGKQYRVKPSKLYVIGSSFGGPAAILASRDPRVTKAVGLSPVIDWRAPSRAEPMSTFYDVTKEAFGEGYRMSRKNFNKLKTGRFYNPAHEVKTIDGKKLLIMHWKDDESVGYREVATFAKRTGAEFVLGKRGGHVAGKALTIPRFAKKILKFLRT